MRIGEIVKLPDGRIGRLTEIKGSSYIVAGIMRSKTELTAIANVADVFEYAGFPVPSGAMLCYDAGADNWFHTTSRGHVCWWTNLDGGRWVNPIHVREADWLGRHFDLSRLPAADAWDALPEAVTGQGGGE